MRRQISLTVISAEPSLKKAENSISLPPGKRKRRKGK
jgi:hypothetical protein